MSTLSTHLNWGASYLTNDVYKRFIAPESSEKTQLRIGQFSTVILMILAMLFSLVLESALDGFQILLQIGAGTGLIFLLRWFWMRINAAAEIAAMIVSFLIAVFFKLIYPRIFISELQSWQELIIGVGITTAIWMITAFITKPTDAKVIDNFKRVTKYEKVNLKYGIICSFLGATSIYSALFTTGKIIYGEYFQSILLSLVTVVSLFMLGQMWKKLDLES
jgi:Na+/proline symporter